MTPEDMAVKLEAVDQRSRSNAHRLDDVEKRQDNLDKLVTSVEVLATKQETVEGDVKEIKSDVKAQVADILVNECGLPELVPSEYGGTADA